jgi:hypothetical protein
MINKIKGIKLNNQFKLKRWQRKCYKLYQTRLKNSRFNISEYSLNIKK